jgi:hypothetical protein
MAHPASSARASPRAASRMRAPPLLGELIRSGESPDAQKGGGAAEGCGRRRSVGLYEYEKRALLLGREPS